jgi:aminopeptidase N
MARIKPTNYSLSLHDLELGGDWSYQGNVKIALDIKKSAKEIVLHANQLTIHSAELSTEHTKTESAVKASSISYDKDAQRATLSFDEAFPTASKAWLDIKFQGTINNVGFLFPHFQFVILTLLGRSWLAFTDLVISQQ